MTEHGSHIRPAKVSSTMQEASEDTRASFPDLRDVLNDLGVKTGDRVPTEAVDAAADWLNLEGQQGISDVVEQDRQDLALEHILHDTAGDSTGYEDNGDDEDDTDYNNLEEIKLCLDRLDGLARANANENASYHVQKLRDEVAKTFAIGKEPEGNIKTDLIPSAVVLDEIRPETLKPAPGSKRRPKRKGRGISAGQGASCGFGMRGQKSRSGPGVRAGFEGGQTPLYRRVPKLVGRPMGPGHQKKVFNLIKLEALNTVEDGSTVNFDSLYAAGKVTKTKYKWHKVVGGDELTVQGLTVQAHGFTKSAVAAIEANGGKCQLLSPTTNEVLLMEDDDEGEDEAVAEGEDEATVNEGDSEEPGVASVDEEEPSAE